MYCVWHILLLTILREGVVDLIFGSLSRRAGNVMLLAKKL